MIPRFFLAALLAAVLGLPLKSNAVTFSDNGSPNLLDGFDLTYLKEGNRFTLSADVVAKSVKFWTIEPHTGTWANLVFWEIRLNTAANLPGTVLSSGNSTNLTHAGTGRVVAPDAPYPEFLITFDLPSVSLPAGTYWLVLHNGALSNNNILLASDILWETTTKIPSDPAYRPSFCDPAPFTNNWDTNDLAPPKAEGSQVAFQLIGTVRPKVTTFGFVSAKPQVSFTTVTGQNYKVEFKNNLTDASWTTVSGASNVTGTGGVVPINDNDPNLPTIRHRFYRVTVL
ncbi:MAG TPA: hypothetical protein VGM62_11600 [Chthoniobacterales bacterium]